MGCCLRQRKASKQELKDHDTDKEYPADIEDGKRPARQMSPLSMIPSSSASSKSSHETKKQKEAEEEVMDLIEIIGTSSDLNVAELLIEVDKIKTGGVWYATTPVDDGMTVMS